MISLVEQTRKLRIALKHFGHRKKAGWLKKTTLELSPYNMHLP